MWLLLVRVVNVLSPLLPSHTQSHKPLELEAGYRCHFRALEGPVHLPALAEQPCGFGSQTHEALQELIWAGFDRVVKHFDS